MKKLNQIRIVPLLTIAIGILFLAIALIYGLTSGTTLSTETATPPQDTQDVPRISLPEAKNAYDSGEAIFLDVRDVESYLAGHIPGALSIPLSELQVRYSELPDGTLIIPY